MCDIWKPTDAWKALDIGAHLAKINQLPTHDITADTLKKILAIPTDPGRVIVHTA
jgi:hypothetical protein